MGEGEVYCAFSPVGFPLIMHYEGKDPAFKMELCRYTKDDHHTDAGCLTDDSDY